MGGLAGGRMSLTGDSVGGHTLILYSNCPVLVLNLYCFLCHSISSVTFLFCGRFHIGSESAKIR